MSEVEKFARKAREGSPREEAGESPEEEKREPNGNGKVQYRKHRRVSRTKTLAEKDSGVGRESQPSKVGTSPVGKVKQRATFQQGDSGVGREGQCAKAGVGMTSGKEP